MKNILKKNNQKGSLMVEALALLGLITMVTPVLYKKAAERTTELQDINVATQMRMISSAVDDFLKDNYKEVGETYPNDVFSLTDADRETLEKYLPKGFDLTQSRLFDEFQIMVRREEVEDRKGKKHNIYTSAVLAPTTEDLTRMRSSKIASMIGSSGGVYRDGMLQGVQGSWTADPVNDYGFTTDGVRNESLAVISTKAISSAKGDVSSDDVLFRIDTGDEADNTMQATLFMDGNEIRGLTNLIASAAGGGGASANQIVIGRKNGDIVQQITDLFITGRVNIKDSLTVDGETTLNNGLNVTAGDTNIAGNLNVAGDTTLEKLTVNGDTQLHNTNIDGDLVQSGGKVEFNATQITMNSDGPVNINSKDNININADKNLYMNGGDSVHIQQGGEDRIVINNEGNTITGDTTFKDGDVTVENNLNVGGDVTVEGDVILVRPEGEESNVMADWLHAKKGIKIGGQATENTSAGNYFTVDSTGTNVKVGTFNVRDKLYVNNSKLSYGGEPDTAGNKINVSATGTAFLGYKYNPTLAATENKQGFYSALASNYMSLRRGSGVSGTDIYQNAGSTYIRSFDADNLKRSEIYTSSGGGIYLTSNEDNEGSVRSATRLALNNYGTVLDSYKDGSAKSLTIDETGLALFDSSKTLSRTTRSVKPIDAETNTTGSILQTNAKVAIGRQGIVEVAAPTSTDNNGGYFKGRRLVSDKKYEEGGAFSGYTYSGGDVKKKYDYYQVNPAYTSVMNDIKLATRGGARLSDILPDYINKGIYVVDNTYQSSKITEWEGKWLENIEECKNGTAIDNTCIASPWMGYVPAPQCPKNYAKVITLNPIRWRMSEVYTIFDTANWPASGTTNYKKLIGGDDFKKYFIQPTDPRHAEFKLSDGGGEAHTHTPQEGRPLTFQTNTWLNTTISPLYGCPKGSGTCTTSGNSKDFVGWHAIMGFIYRPTQYNTLLTELGASPNNNVVYWNIFPVYAGDMAAVANVYCYFERNTATTDTSWQWGNSSPVYRYDQMNAYKHGFEKDADWNEAVNDPQLGYDDAW